MSNRDDMPAEVTIRDLDRIREKVTFTIEPFHLILAGSGFFLLIVAALLIGIHLGGAGRGNAMAESASSEPTPLLNIEPKPQPRETRTQHVKAVLPAPRATEAKVRPEDMEDLSLLSRRGPVAVPIPPPDPRSSGELLIKGRRGVASINLSQEAGPWPSIAVTDVSLCASCIWADGVCGPYFPKPRDQRDVVLPPPNMETPKASARYEVQVCSYREESMASEHADKLRSKGYRTRIIKFVDQAGVTWYRVRVGSFDSVSKAQEFTSRFNAREGERAIAVLVER